MAFCSVCRQCDHPASRHRLVGSDGPLAGPYKCLHCPCEMMHHDPTYGWTRRQFYEWNQTNPDPGSIPAFNERNRLEPLVMTPERLGAVERLHSDTT